MYRVPSRRKTKKQMAKPNLIPILDAVFIFIFFLLMSANFIKIFEISSDVPIVSTVEPPKSLLILDDVLGSPAILQSSGLTKIATLNRHIAPLQENYKGRSACGLAVIILSRSYKMQNGISRSLR